MKYVSILFAFSMFTSSAFAGGTLSTIGSQDDILAEIEQQISNIQKQRQEYWHQKSIRKAELIEITTYAIDEFKTKNKRYPTAKDKAFIKQVYDSASVTNSHESQLIFIHMDQYITHSRNN